MGMIEGSNDWTPRYFVKSWCLTAHDSHVLISGHEDNRTACAHESESELLVLFLETWMSVHLTFPPIGDHNRAEPD